MKGRIIRKVLDDLEPLATPGSAKNVYEAYSTHRKKEAGFELELAGLCAKIAMGGNFAPKIPKPRLSIPGASANVGKWNPLKGTAGRSPPAIGAKGVAPSDVVNPRRNITQAMTAFTSKKSTS